MNGPPENMAPAIKHQNKRLHVGHAAKRAEIDHGGFEPRLDEQERHERDTENREERDNRAGVPAVALAVAEG